MLVALLVLLRLSIPVYADWDYELEAREKAEAKAAAERQAAIDKKNSASAGELFREENIDTSGQILRTDYRVVDTDGDSELRACGQPLKFGGQYI